MAKSVYRPTEIKTKDSGRLTLKLIHDYAPPKEEVEEEKEEYKGPTIEDIKKEADAYKAGWEIEKRRMTETAHAEAESIISDAKKAAFEEVKRQTDQAQVMKSNAEKEAESIVKKANDEAASIVLKAHNDEKSVKDAAYKTAFDEGKEAGFESGKAENERLVAQIHKIIDSVMKRRTEILLETESQIINLVLLMTRKVVKVISESQKEVVTNNVLSALNKLKTHSDVTIRVNMEDLEITNAHTNDFIRQIENLEGVKVIEDASIDKGGCVVETDFGAIDARISSQLNELETKILEVSPEKINKTKKE